MGESKTVPEAPRITVRMESGAVYNDVRVAFQAYQDPAGGVAVILYWFDAEEGFEDQLAVATVNLSKYGWLPEPGCAFIKTWGGNEGILESLIREKIVEPTSRIEMMNAYGSQAVEVRFIGDWADRWLQAVIEGNAMRARAIDESGRDR